MKTLRRAAAGATAALTVLVPAVAAHGAPASTSGYQPAAGRISSAPDDAVWQKVHDRLVSHLQARVQTLAKLATSVNGDQTLSPQDKTALSGLLSNETSGIDSLLSAAQVATPQTTTIAQLRADAKEMVDKFRVYLVMSRQVHLTEAAHAQTTTETRFEGKESKVQAAISRAGNPPDAVTAYSDLVYEVAHGTQATGDAQIPAVLAVTPPGYPADEGPLTAARSALAQAKTDLTAARGDLKTIRNVVNQHDSTNQPTPGAGPSTSSPSGS